MQKIKFTISVLLLVTLCAGCVRPQPMPAPSVPGGVFENTQDVSSMPESRPLLPACLQVPYISQFPTYPTGCETVSTLMVLAYYGKGLSAQSFIEKYLPRQELYYKEGILCGPDPNVAFVGDPRSKNGYGCFAPAIEKALTAYLGAGQVHNCTGTALPELCATYIDHGQPVLLWATVDMQNPKASTRWRLPDGTTFTWTSPEHCLVLIGYDTENYYFNDPMVGAAVPYSKALAEARYAQMGSQALVVCPAER